MSSAAIIHLPAEILAIIITVKKAVEGLLFNNIADVADRILVAKTYYRSPSSVADSIISAIPGFFRELSRK
jgi:predicted TPR repeat methyltransferase